VGVAACHDGPVVEDRLHGDGVGECAHLLRGKVCRP
jgi:hypothetical protein